MDIHDRIERLETRAKWQKRLIASALLILLVGGLAAASFQAEAPQPRILAWVNFHGDDNGTLTVYDKFNVKEVKKEGTGRYRVIFEEPIREKYGVLLGSGLEHCTFSQFDSENRLTTDRVIIMTTNPGNSPQDGRVSALVVANPVP